MSQNLELFLDQVLKTAEQQLGISPDDMKSDDTYSIMLELMKPNSVLVAPWAEALAAEIDKKLDPGTHDDPMSYPLEE